ncbi:MAG: hypothetical protein ACLRMJ_03835 [Alistipes finegoldii]
MAVTGACTAVNVGVVALHGLPLRSVTVSVTAVSDGVADAVTSSAPA